MARLISGWIVGISILLYAHSAGQRYTSRRETDTVWIPRNVCAYRFRLDNGCSGEGFGPLTVSLRLKDKSGNTLAMGNMAVSAFGDSDATRSQEASFENECVENVNSIEIMKASEENNGAQINLPLAVFDPQYYTPLPVSVAGSKSS